MSEAVLIGFLIVCTLFVLRANEKSKRRKELVIEIQRLHKELLILNEVHQKIWALLQNPSQHLDLSEEAYDFLSDEEKSLLKNLSSISDREVINFQNHIRSKINEHTVLKSKLVEQLKITA
ncbi:hypothetical protein [Paenibacillus tepidiphilus]|uniref:hypothetical protein n=1 Tax=Paenibacillus tepidiphilus TaxID=2608683 RepID=UPI00123907F2|nr:hypothetical protein [Paenibacillus tepidiphilus]